MKPVFKLTYSLAVLVTLAVVATYAGSADTMASPDTESHSAAHAVATYHNDNGRTGLNPNETLLTPANVNVAQFGKLFSFPVDGLVYAQPLYCPEVNVPGRGIMDLVFVTTEHDSVYAFDANGQFAEPVWRVSFLVNGATTVPAADVGSTIVPEIGITGTPVLDPATRTLYLIALTNEGGGYLQRLHALDIASGKEKLGAPVIIEACVPGSGAATVDGFIHFDAKLALQRAALLLANGRIYIAWASHGDTGPYHGWVMAYDAATLQRVGVWNTTPDGFQGGIWMSGAGLSADAAGSIYGVSGNGHFNVPGGGASYSDTFFKLSPDIATVQDWFTPYNQHALSRIDADLGSAGTVLLPDQPGAHPHLVISAGKEGRIYLLDRDNLGHFNSVADSQIVQSLPKALGTGTEYLSFSSYSSPAYWNGWVYFAGVDDTLSAFRLTNGRLSTTPARSANTYAFPGATPAVSANGNTNGIVWTTECGENALHAHDAGNLSVELYNSNQNASRDALGRAVKFSVPTVVHGRVYVGTSNALVVYGLLK